MKTNTPVTPVPIKTIITHVALHADEAYAIWLLRKYGEKMFPGVSSAPIQFVEKDPELADEAYDRDGILPVGCGHGRFDEHRDDIERIPGQCSATLVFRYLAIADPAAEKILREILHCDANSGAHVTQIAEIMKSGHRRLKTGPEWILRWAVSAFDAIHTQETYHYAERRGEKTVGELFRKYVEARGCDNDKVRSYMFQQLGRSNKHNGSLLTELSTVVTALYRTSMPIEDVEEWVRFPFERMVEDQTAFWKAVDFVTANGKYFIIEACLAYETAITVLVIHTDDELALRAANYIGGSRGNIDVTMIRQSSGNVQFFAQAEDVSLDTLTAMIRWTEARAKNGRGPNVAWHELTIAGRHETAPDWYYQREARMLFNGSKTHPGVAATAISSQFLIDMMHAAFHPRSIDLWKRNREIGIPVPARVVSKVVIRNDSLKKIVAEAVEKELGPALDRLSASRNIARLDDPRIEQAVNEGTAELKLPPMLSEEVA